MIGDGVPFIEPPLLPIGEACVCLPECGIGGHAKGCQCLIERPSPSFSKWYRTQKPEPESKK